MSRLDPLWFKRRPAPPDVMPATLPMSAEAEAEAEEAYGDFRPGTKIVIERFAGGFMGVMTIPLGRRGMKLFDAEGLTPYEVLEGLFDQFLAWKFPDAADATPGEAEG
jgi:hypothetical protein